MGNIVNTIFGKIEKYLYNIFGELRRKEMYTEVRKDAKADIFDVANFFLLKEEMSNKKIQKLCYYAEAWSWALLNHSIVEDVKFEAWVHGPVNYELYEEFKRFGWNEVKIDTDENKRKAETEIKERFTKGEINILESVWETYGDMSGDQLEYQTHQEEPWIEARGDAGKFESVRNVINPQTMRKFYRSVYTGEPV